jgi:undecaprenyl diphosphate synthase
MERKVKEVNNIQHVAIIMDGNGRWAQKRGLGRIEGHKAGAETVKNLLNIINKYGVKYLTIYAFSTENWKRPKEEVFGLMDLLKEFLNINLETLKEKGIRLRTIGRIKDIPILTRRKLENAIKTTQFNTNGQLIIALSYGGRTEIVDAAVEIAKDIKKGKLKPNEIDDKLFSSYLYAPDIPDPDLMIRTSGEFRISNFLLWQLSYSELWITDTLWPDFKEKDFAEAINSYKNRKRRFGGV